MSASGTAAYVSLWDLVRAEVTRSRRTFTWGVIGATLIFTVHTIILANASISSGVVAELQWNGNALAWMHMYAGGFAVPLGLLTGAMAQWREQRWRQGGTAWRAVAPRRVAGARIVVLSLSALACQVALVAPVVVHALIVGSGWGPWDRYLLFATYMWIVVTGACAWGMAAFRVLRVIAVGIAPVLGFVWSVMGVVQAERSDWWMLPWAWTARVPLPLLGVHGSSVLLEADSPVWGYPLLPGFLLTAALTLAGTGLAVLGGTSGGIESSAWFVVGLRRLLPGGQATDAQPENVSEQAPVEAPTSLPRSTPQLRAAPATRMARIPGPRSAVLAMAGVLPWIVWVVLATLLLAFLGVLHTVYPPGYGQSFLELMGVPVAAALVGITVWGRLQPAWRTLITRQGSCGILTSAAVLSALFLIPVLVVSWIVTVVGDTLTRTDPNLPAVTGPVYGLLVMPAVAFMIAAVSLAVALSTRIVVAIVLNVILVIMGLLIGGNDVMAATWLWRLAPWGWMAVAHQFPERWLEIGLLSLLIGSVAMGAAVLGARRAATRE
ncbi:MULTISPECIES: hypothetical protein [Actinomyces]|uniref:Uncharacterized protein n=1 Tax=Actinomyces oris TaxID=544580 RepID=A0A1Q8VQ76_9ACTO|nr:MULTISPECIES: hypothetical protein [Actinomyces]OLO50244.1 hypothetical protein BKH28_03605 [Actinomyces oris]